MAIVTFWSNGKEETAKTLSIVAVATNMAIEHNYKILLLSTAYNDESLELCYWENGKDKRKIGGIKFGGINSSFDSGIEGLAKVVNSNRATPEVIKDYTKVVFKDRLDVILSVKSKSYEEYERLRTAYLDIILAANQYYDLVFVDVNKGIETEFVRSILESSDLIVSNITQRTKIIDNFMELRKKEKIFKGDKNMILVGRYDKFSKYNAKNISKYMGEKREVSVIPYNTLFFEACNEGSVADYFLRIKTVDESDRNAIFVKAVNKTTEEIDYRLQELRMKM